MTIFSAYPSFTAWFFAVSLCRLSTNSLHSRSMLEFVNFSCRWFGLWNSVCFQLLCGMRNWYEIAIMKHLNTWTKCIHLSPYKSSTVCQLLWRPVLAFVIETTIDWILELCYYLLTCFADCDYLLISPEFCVICVHSSWI